MKRENARLLRNRNYRLLLEAGLINRFGDSVDALAMTWLMYSVSQSASLTALNFGLNFLPTVLFQPFCGAFVGKRDLKRVMVVADLIRAVLIGTVALLATTGLIQSYMLLIFTFLISTVEAFRVPSQTAVIPLILEQEDYSLGQSLSSSLSSVVQLIGTAIAGSLIALLGVSAGIWIDTGCFFASALLIGLMRPRRPEGAPPITGGVWADTMDGLRYLKSDPLLLVICAIAVLINALVVPFSSLEAAMCSELFDRGPEVLSVIGVAITLGNIPGGALFSRIEKKAKPNLLMFFCFAGVSLFYLACVAAGRLREQEAAFNLLITIVPFLMGIAIAWINIYASVLMLKHVSEEYLSRVSAVLGALCAAGMPVASFLVSILAGYFSIAAIFTAAALMTGAAGCLVARNKALREAASS